MLVLEMPRRKTKTEEPTEEEMIRARRFGRVLQDAIVRRGLNPNSAKDVVGYSSTYLYQLIDPDKHLEGAGDIKRPPEKTIRQIARGLGVPEDYLLHAWFDSADDDLAGLIRVKLQTGDVILIDPKDKDPENTADATAAFLKTFRQMRDNGN